MLSGAALPEHCPGPESSTAGKESACEGCPNRTACQSGNPYCGGLVDDLRLARIIDSIQNRVLIMSGKGGVGKSTVCAVLCMALSEQRKLRVGCIDGDLCGPNLPRLMDVEDESIRRVFVDNENKLVPVYVNDNLSLISSAFLLKSKQDALIWRGHRKNGLLLQFVRDVQWSDIGDPPLDCLVADSPPGTSDEHLSLCNLLKPIGVVLVTSRHKLSTQDVRRQITFCKKLNLRVLAIVENMSYVSCPHCQHVTELFAANCNTEVQRLYEMFDQSQRPRHIRLPASPLLANPTNLFNQRPDDQNLLSAIEELCSVITS